MIIDTFGAHSTESVNDHGELRLVNVIERQVAGGGQLPVV